MEPTLYQNQTVAYPYIYDCENTDDYYSEQNFINTGYCRPNSIISITKSFDPQSGEPIRNVKYINSCFCGNDNVQAQYTSDENDNIYGQQILSPEIYQNQQPRKNYFCKCCTLSNDNSQIANKTISYPYQVENLRTINSCENPNNQVYNISKKRPIECYSQSKAQCILNNSNNLVYHSRNKSTGLKQASSNHAYKEVKDLRKRKTYVSMGKGRISNKQCYQSSKPNVYRFVTLCAQQEKNSNYANNTFYATNKNLAKSNKKKAQKSQEKRTNSSNSHVKFDNNSNYNKNPNKIVRRSTGLPQKRDLINLGVYDINENNFDEDNKQTIKDIKAVTLAGKEEKGASKRNQDAYVALKNLNGIQDFNIYGALDGHGPSGEQISKVVARFIPAFIVKNPQIKNAHSAEEIYSILKSNNWQLINSAYTQAEEYINTLDCERGQSGTTCNLIFQAGKHIICANTGDSRAILIYDSSKNNSINSSSQNKIFCLSRDQKADLPGERKRIEMYGGFIDRCFNEKGEKEGPYRVWVKGQNYPGIAMSRSIGDSIATSLGVVADPEISEYTINSKTKYLVVATDGVWEFLTNEDVMNICDKYYDKNDATGLCNELGIKAAKSWDIEENEGVVDDITAVVAFY